MGGGGYDRPNVIPRSYKPGISAQQRPCSTSIVVKLVFRITAGLSGRVLGKTVQTTGPANPKNTPRPKPTSAGNAPPRKMRHHFGTVMQPTRHAARTGKCTATDLKSAGMTYY